MLGCRGENLEYKLKNLNVVLGRIAFMDYEERGRRGIRGWGCRCLWGQDGGKRRVGGGQNTHKAQETIHLTEDILSAWILPHYMKYFR